MKLALHNHMMMAVAVALLAAGGAARAGSREDYAGEG